MVRWGALAATVLDKIPLERMLFREPDHSKDREKLKDIVDEMRAKGEKLQTVSQSTAEDETYNQTEETEAPIKEVVIPVKTHLKHRKEVISEVSTEETVAYENRELGKALLSIEKHAAQLFRINGKPCDCGQSRHLLFLETEAEDAISMVDNPEIYQRILDFVRRLGPISTVEALQTGQYEDQYPLFAQEARNLRKDLIGTIDPKALWPNKTASFPFPKKELPAAEETNPAAENNNSPIEIEAVKPETSIVSVR